jgi:DNA-binding SARP family transcriptional activator
LQAANGRELQTILAQPKRFALLTYLAVRPTVVHRRDSLLALFWPDLDDTHARWALGQALRFLRKELASSSTDVLIGRSSDEIAVNPAALWCDAAAFREHVETGQFREALDLYRDDLLKGFFADAGAEFDEWLARERNVLRAQAAKAARALAELHERQLNFTMAVAAARRALDLSEVDERLLRELLELLDG